MLRRYLVMKRRDQWHVVADGSQWNALPSEQEAMAAARAAAAVDERQGMQVEISLDDPHDASR